MVIMRAQLMVLVLVVLVLVLLVVLLVVVLLLAMLLVLVLLVLCLGRPASRRGHRARGREGARAGARLVVLGIVAVLCRHGGCGRLRGKGVAEGGGADRSSVHGQAVGEGVRVCVALTKSGHTRLDTLHHSFQPPTPPTHEVSASRTRALLSAAAAFSPYLTRR